MEEKEPRTNTVKSIRKAFNILEELDRAGDLSLAEISERLEMDKGTAFRLLGTMREAGYVLQNKDTKRYSNSLKLFAMGNRAADHTGIRHLARPYLEELTEKSGESSNLGLRVGNGVVFVDKVDSSETIKAGLTVGNTVPLYCTGMGKAILAFLSEEECKDAVSGVRFHKYTSHTVASKEELRVQLQKVHEQGYCRDDEEYVDNLICFASPIFDYHGNPIGAVSLSTPKYRYEPGKTDEAFSKLIQEAARRISKEIGYNAREAK